jgi:hypothetical protein
MAARCGSKNGFKEIFSKVGVKILKNEVWGKKNPSFKFKKMATLNTVLTTPHCLPKLTENSN